MLIFYLHLLTPKNSPLKIKEQNEITFSYGIIYSKVVGILYIYIISVYISVYIYIILLSMI